MTAGFGPAKGKDFATSLGPWITTLDEIDLEDLTMLARVNGEEWSRGSTSTLTWSLAEIVAYVSRNESSCPAQVIGSGTVGLGCGLELFRKLQPGDVVELEIEGIGVLRNTIGEPPESFCSPHPSRGPRRSRCRNDLRGRPGYAGRGSTTAPTCAAPALARDTHRRSVRGPGRRDGAKLPNCAACSEFRTTSLGSGDPAIARVDSRITMKTIKTDRGEGRSSAR